MIEELMEELDQLKHKIKKLNVDLAYLKLANAKRELADAKNERTARGGGHSSRLRTAKSRARKLETPALLQRIEKARLRGDEELVEVLEMVLRERS